MICSEGPRLAAIGQSSRSPGSGRRVLVAALGTPPSAETLALIRTLGL